MMADFTKTEHLDGRVTLYGGDNRDVLKSLDDNSIDSIVTDPPYALVSIVKRFGKPGSAPVRVDDMAASNDLKAAYARASAGFMGKQWDTGEVAFSEVFWAECLRVLKPGGHVVAFSGTRTYHRMAVAIEDAGFEIRDDILEMFATERPAEAFLNSLNNEQRSAFARLLDDTQFTGLLGWAYGSGFPKSHDVSKAIDKAAGAERVKVRVTNVRNPKATDGGKDGMEGATRPWIEAALERGYHEKVGDEPATQAARRLAGWGTALKPAWEPICLARKPLAVPQEQPTGETYDSDRPEQPVRMRAATVAENVLEHGTGAINIDGCRVGDEERYNPAAGNQRQGVAQNANILSGTDPDAPGRVAVGRWPANIVHDGSEEVLAAFPDSKSSGPSGYNWDDSNNDNPTHVTRNIKSGVHFSDSGSAARFFYTAKADKLDRIGSKHPTVKPVDLMQWLCRLVTPPGGLVLDPFAGSGSTGEAAWREGFRAILIEREEEYQADIAERLRLANAGPATRKARAVKQVANDNLPLFGGVEATGGGGQRGEGRQIYGHFADQDGRRDNGR